MYEQIQLLFCTGSMEVLASLRQQCFFDFMSLRFRFTDLKWLLLKGYILTRVWVFLSIFSDHMLMD